jgi:hypothetical protein
MANKHLALLVSFSVENGFKIRTSGSCKTLLPIAGRLLVDKNSDYYSVPFSTKLTKDFPSKQETPPPVVANQIFPFLS